MNNNRDFKKTMRLRLAELKRYFNVPDNWSERQKKRIHKDIDEHYLRQNPTARIYKKGRPKQKRRNDMIGSIFSSIGVFILKNTVLYIPFLKGFAFKLLIKGVNSLRKTLIKKNVTKASLGFFSIDLVNMEFKVKYGKLCEFAKNTKNPYDDEFAGFVKGCAEDINELEEEYGLNQ